jgi:CO/xanthine dehydrogenase FAD-binding subunit
MAKDEGPAFDVWNLGSRAPWLSFGRVHVFQPSTLKEALRTRREVPDAVVVAGGTEVMPARNQGRRPGPLLDLSRVPELQSVG